MQLILPRPTLLDIRPSWINIKDNLEMFLEPSTVSVVSTVTSNLTTLLTTPFKAIAPRDEVPPGVKGGVIAPPPSDSYPATICLPYFMTRALGSSSKHSYVTADCFTVINKYDFVPKPSPCYTARVQQQVAASDNVIRDVD